MKSYEAQSNFTCTRDCCRFSYYYNFCYHWSTRKQSSRYIQNQPGQLLFVSGVHARCEPQHPFDVSLAPKHNMVRSQAPHGTPSHPHHITRTPYHTIRSCNPVKSVTLNDGCWELAMLMREKDSNSIPPEHLFHERAEPGGSESKVTWSTGS